MKKLFCLSAALFIAVVLVMANPLVTGNGPDTKKKTENRKKQQREKSEISLRPPTRAIEFEFSQDFPNAKYVTWAEGRFVEASFLDNDVLKIAYYDEDNHLIGTTADVDASALPEKAKDNIDKIYPGYTIEKVVFFDDNEANDTNMFLFNHSFEDEDDYFPLLVKDSSRIILKVSLKGEVSFFENLK
jgi:hypothetical protein